MSDMYIYGAGGHAKVVAAAARLCGYNIMGFWEDSVNNIGKHFFGSRIVAFEDIPPKSDIFIAFGDNRQRFKYGNILREHFNIRTIIHPSAQIAENVKLGEGVFVGAMANIDPCCTIGNFCIINNSVVISHDSIIEDACLLCGGAVIAGGVTIGTESFIGIGSDVIERVKIGSRVIVGAGGVVIDNLPSDVTAVGCPAKIVKRR